MRRVLLDHVASISETEIAKLRIKVGEQTLVLYLEESSEAVSIHRLSRSVDCSPATIAELGDQGLLSRLML